MAVQKRSDKSRYMICPIGDALDLRVAVSIIIEPRKTENIKITGGKET